MPGWDDREESRKQLDPLGEGQSYRRTIGRLCPGRALTQTILCSPTQAQRVWETHGSGGSLSSEEGLQLLQRTLVQVPESMSGSSELPVRPAPGDLITSSGLHGHPHTCMCADTHVQTYIRE